MASPEVNKSSPENQYDTANLERAGEEQREALRDQLEKAESKKEKESIQEVRHEALDAAQASHETTALQTREKSPAERRGPIGKAAREAQREASFQNQLEGARHSMSTSSKNFSKIIHNKAVEKASDAIGSTVARPNALLFGSIFAFISVTIVYLVAKNYGYQLSGFETIAAFILGWVLGLLYDFVRLMIHGSK